MRTSPSSRSPTGRKGREEYKKESWLLFGYNLQYDADLLIVRRSDGTFVAAFNAGKVDLAYLGRDAVGWLWENVQEEEGPATAAKHSSPAVNTA